jgi:hypothetical protein
MHKSFNLTKKSSHDFEFFQIFKKSLVKRRKRNLKRQFQSNKIESFFDF